MEGLLIASIVALWIIVLMNLLITVALVRHVRKASAPHQPDLLKVGELAPEFNLKTLGEDILTLSDFRNKELLMVFMSAECGHCRPQMPVLKEIAPKAKQDNVNLVLVGLGEQERIQDFVNEFELEIPTVITERAGHFASSYKVPGTPSYYLINRDGRIAKGGFLDESWTDLIKDWRQPMSRTK